MTEIIDPAILERYELLSILGTGSTSTVWKAVDRKNDQIVVLKKIDDALRFKSEAALNFKDLFIMKEFLTQENKNFLKPLELVKSYNNRDLYIIFEYLEINLSQLNKSFRLKREQITYIIFQLVNSVKQLHSQGIIHRDLRPDNILLNTEYLVKLKNFKSARLSNKYYFDSADQRSTYELYSGRLTYRAPEIILGGYEHTKSMDMWSIGCILAELLLGKTAFTGSTILSQLEQIKLVLGEPTTEELESINAVHKSQFFKYSTKVEEE